MFVPLDFRLDDAAAAHLLKHSGARAAVVGGSHREQAARLAAAGGCTPATSATWMARATSIWSTGRRTC